MKNLKTCSPSVLKLRSFTSFVERYARLHVFDASVIGYVSSWRHVSSRDFYGLCVNALTGPGKSLAVWMNRNQTFPGQMLGHIIRVFSGISVWKGLIYTNKTYFFCFTQIKHILCLTAATLILTMGKIHLQSLIFLNVK